MRKHTFPMILLVLVSILVGAMGSMQSVYATEGFTPFVTAGAARAFGVKTQVSKSENSEKGNQQAKISTTATVPAATSPAATTPAETVDIVITAQKDDGATTGAQTTEKSNKQGEVAGIPYDKLVMANVQEAVNVRSEASEDSSLLGKFYTECAGTILDTANGWTKVQTGELTGWIKNDYLLFGDSAVELAEKVVEQTATSTTDCLRVRKSADPDATVLTLLAKGETIAAVDTEGDWVKVEFSDGEEGFVSAEYVSISDEIGKGETMEAINAREEAEKKEREEAAEAEKRAKVEASRTTETKVTNNGAIPGDVNDVQLLAALIQCEGGNQPYEGQVSIGTVVMNRLRSGRYGTSIYSVIYAKGQFGPAGTGAVANVYAAGPKASCLQAAQDAMNGVSYIGTATHFRNIRSGYPGIVIGSHVFW